MLIWLLGFCYFTFYLYDFGKYVTTSYKATDNDVEIVTNTTLLTEI